MTLVYLIMAFGLGFLTAVVGFLWINRKNPSALDAAEDAVRKS